MLYVPSRTTSTEMSMAWEPDRRFNFFFNPPAHLYAVTCMTEISLNVTLDNHIQDYFYWDVYNILNRI